MRTTGRELAAPALLAVIVAAQMLLQSQLLHNGTNFDEGVYLAAVDALRHGQQLGTEVFAAQFPGFYRPAPRRSGGGRCEHHGYPSGTDRGLLSRNRRRLADRTTLRGTPGAALTAGLFVVAPPLDLFGSQVIADTPALALTMFAVGLATVAGPVAAVGVGIAFALGLSVKLTAVTAVPALVWYLRRRTLLAVSAAKAFSSALCCLRCTPGNWEAFGRALFATTKTRGQRQRSSRTPAARSSTRSRTGRPSSGLRSRRSCSP